MENKMNKLVIHLKETGYVYQGSSIYGGLSNTWDYGPLGSLMIKNIKDIWWKEFITKKSNIVSLDSKIILNNKVWEASGHTQNFIDLLIENKVNKKRYRVDKLIEDVDSSVDVSALTIKQTEKWIKNNVKEFDKEKTNWSNIKQFNLMFETAQGPLLDSKSRVYLRPEIAQGIFINFLNVQKTFKLKIPFGIAQIGKSFRNEITPKNFIFRTREFEQMEIEYFVKPGEDEKEFNSFIKKIKDFIFLIGLKEENIRLREHKKEDLSHYAKKTIDIEYKFPFGWGELIGISNRGDYDLKTHSKHSEVSLQYKDPFTNKVYTPYVIEPSIGVDRLLLALLVDAFVIETLKNNEKRIILKLDKKIAPYKVAVLPLVKKVHSQVAKKVYEKLLSQNISTFYDETGSIGKRYRKQDAIGTPFVLTVIDQTAKENKVTIRFRDDMSQKEINLDDLNEYLY